MYQAKKHIIKPWMVMLIALAVLIGFFYLLGDILTPFIIAAVLAYILNPIVEKLRKYKIKRGLASMIVTVLTLFILFALMLIIVPMLIKQFSNLTAQLPNMVGYIQNKVLPVINHFAGEHIQIDSESIIDWLQSHTGSVNTALQKIAPTIVKQSSSVVLGITNLFLLPFLLYYFLVDWQRWGQGIRSMIPRRYVETYTRITGNMDQVLSEFLRGQLTVMLIMGLIYGTSLMLTGLDSGFAIGIIAGILVFVPYLGAFTGLLLATLAALFQFGSFQHILIVWGVFAVGQFLESFFITPKIVGDRIGLSPFWVIFSLMAFGQLMGFVGMLAGLPLAAVSLVLIREGRDAYFKSRFYQHNKN